MQPHPEHSQDSYIDGPVPTLIAQYMRVRAFSFVSQISNSPIDFTLNQNALIETLLFDSVLNASTD